MNEVTLEFTVSEAQELLNVIVALIDRGQNDGASTTLEQMRELKSLRDNLAEQIDSAQG